MERFLLQETIAIEVPFHDVDAMEVVWHGHYVRYIEVARNQLLRRLDYDYPQMRASGYAWPVVDMQLRFIKSAAYRDRLDVVAGLIDYENRLKIGYRILKNGTGEVLTKAYTVQVAVNMRTGELELASPQALLAKVHALL